MPSVQRAHNELKKDGIQVITVSIDGVGEAAVKPVFARGGYTMPALIDTKGMIRARTTGHIDFDSAELRNYARSLNRK